MLFKSQEKEANDSYGYALIRKSTGIASKNLWQYPTTCQGYITALDSGRKTQTY